MRVPILIGSACIAALGCLPDQPDGSADDAAAPRVRLRLSGHLEGRLEPCGCASGQMGGLARRAFLLLQDRNYDLLIEGGDLTVDGDELDELKLMTMLSVLSGKAPYHAIGLGPGDLRMATEPLIALFAGFGIPTLASDLLAEGEKLRDGELPWPGVPYCEHVVGDTRVRIASLALGLPSAVL